MGRKIPGEEKGSVMVMVVISLIVLIGFTGLVIDGGQAYLTKSRLQNAADAAALAGAQSLPTAGTAASVAITYAGHNGMKPLVGDMSSSGTTYTAARSADQVITTIEPAIPSTTSTQLAFTAEELAEKRAELELEMGTSTDEVLMDYATLYAISVGMTSVPAHDEADIAAKRTELTALLNGMTNADLIAEAKAKSVTTGITQNPTVAAIDSEILGLGTYLNKASTTDAERIAKATEYNISIETYIKNKNFFKDPVDENRTNAINKIITDRRIQLEQSVIDTISDKPALITALLDIRITAYASETVKTISDKPSLIDAILDALIADFADDTVTVETGGHPDRIRVTCTRTVNNTFMSILGFASQEISATAVAEKVVAWDGDGLPFINVDEFDINGEAFDTWDKTSSGFFSCIHSQDYTVVGTSPDRLFRVKWADGIIPKNGAVSDKKDILEEMWARLAHQKVYVFSLTPDVISRGWVEFAGGTTLDIEDMNNIPNSGSAQYNLKPYQIMLLECYWDGYQHKKIDLTYTGNYWTLEDENTIPEEGMGSVSSTARLVE